MTIYPEQKAVIDLMIRHEDAMRELYSLYSTRCDGEFADFWRQLVKEEGSHADMIRLISVSLEQGKADFKPDRFKPELVEKSLSHINEKISEAKDGKVSLDKALAAALEIEDSFIEHEYFSILDEDSNDLKFILNLLQKGADSHQKRVRSAWESQTAGK